MLLFVSDEKPLERWEGLRGLAPPPAPEEPSELWEGFLRQWFSADPLEAGAVIILVA